MYTSESKFFSEIFKQKTMIAIANQIAVFNAMSTQEFAECLKDNGSLHEIDQIRQFGRRWKDPEEVYQAFVMDLSDRMRQERGPGFMTEQEAKILEEMFLLPTTAYMFDVCAKKAIISAIDCDYYYMFEKRWD